MKNASSRPGGFPTAVGSRGFPGASPGSRLEVNFRGTERLEQTIAQSIRWLAVALVATGTVIGTAATAASDRVPWGVPAAIAASGLVLGAVILVSIVRGRA